MNTCKHEDFFCKVDVNRMEDSGRFMADLTVKCNQCQQPFHFQGVTEFGLLWTAPSLNFDSTELHLPIAPGPSPAQPGTQLRYEVPNAEIALYDVAKRARDFLVAIVISPYKVVMAPPDFIPPVRQLTNLQRAAGELAAALKKVTFLS